MLSLSHTIHHTSLHAVVLGEDFGEFAFFRNSSGCGAQYTDGVAPVISARASPEIRALGSPLLVVFFLYCFFLRRILPPALPSILRRATKCHKACHCETGLGGCITTVTIGLIGQVMNEKLGSFIMNVNSAARECGDVGWVEWPTCM